MSTPSEVEEAARLLAELRERPGVLWALLRAGVDVRLAGPWAAGGVCTFRFMVRGAVVAEVKPLHKPVEPDYYECSATYDDDGNLDRDREEQYEYLMQLYEEECRAWKPWTGRLLVHRGLRCLGHTPEEVMGKLDDELRKEGWSLIDEEG